MTKDGECMTKIPKTIKFSKPSQELLDKLDGILKIIPSDVESARLYELHDGDIFTCQHGHFEYDGKLLYEVVEDGLDEFLQQKWVRTGRVLTPKGLNEF